MNVVPNRFELDLQRVSGLRGMSRSAMLIAFLLCLYLFGRVIASIASTDKSWLILLALVCTPVLIFIACKWPEVTYAIFVDAGLFKGDLRINAVVPDWLDLTIAFALLSLVGIAYKALTSREPIQRLPRSLLIPYLVFTLWAGVSLSFTSAPIYGTDKFLRFATITTLALYGPFLLRLDRRSLRRMLVVFVVIALAMLIDVLEEGIPPFVSETRTAFGSNYLSFGRATGLGLVIVMFYYLVPARKLFTIVSSICVSAFLAVGTFLSGGRGPLLSTLATFAVMAASCCVGLLRRLAWRSRHEPGQLRIVCATILVVAISAVAVNINPEFFAATRSRLTLMLSGSDYSDGRVPRYELAESIATSWPTSVTGVGIGGFVQAFGQPDSKAGDYPHNIFLEVASELGIIGFASFAFMLMWASRQLLAFVVRDDPGTLHIRYTLAGMLVFELINSCLSGDINGNRALFMCIGLMGTQAIDEMHRSRTKESSQLRAPREQFKGDPWLIADKAPAIDYREEPLRSLP